MNVEAISVDLILHQLETFFFGENELCFVFEDRFGLIKLPVQLKEFNLAQAFATKVFFTANALPANLTDLGNEQLLGKFG